MTLLKHSFYIIALLFLQGVSAQEWSSRIAIMEEQLINASTEEIVSALWDVSAQKDAIGFLEEGGAILTIQSESFKAGVNVLFEEDLDKGFLIMDMFVYNIGWAYEMGNFGLSFVFENFLNVNKREFEIRPSLDASYGVVEEVTYFQDSPFSVALGLSFSF